MQFLCSTFGSSGDVFPMLGLALELRARGHAVTLATNPHYEAMARGHGLPFEPLGTREAFAAAARDPHLWHPRRAFRHIFETLKPTLRPQYDAHARLAAAGPVVGITNCFGLGAFNARDRLGVPVVTLHCQPAVIWSGIEPPTLPGLFGPRWLRRLLYGLGERLAIDPPVCRFLNPWRAELGLPPVSRVTRWWHSPDGVLCLFPDWYARPQPDWPAGVMQADFPLWNHKSDGPLPGAVVDFLGRGDPPVVFTPGSMNLHGRGFFAAAVEGLRTLGRRGLFLTEFPEQLPPGLPDTILHAPYVPLDRLLPRAAAFVHHGGVGSTSQAMLAGVPQVLMPLAHDQFDNAARVRRLGVGDGIPAARFTASRLAGALRRLLSSAEVAARCHEVAGRLARRDGLKRAADMIEARFVR